MNVVQPVCTNRLSPYILINSNYILILESIYTAYCENHEALTMQKLRLPFLPPGPAAHWWRLNHLTASGQIPRVSEECCIAPRARMNQACLL